MSSLPKTPQQQESLNADQLLTKARSIRVPVAKRAKFQFKQSPGQIAIQLPLIASIVLAAMVHMSPELNQRWSSAAQPVVAYYQSHFSQGIDDESSAVTEIAEHYNGNVSREMR